VIIAPIINFVVNHSNSTCIKNFNKLMKFLKKDPQLNKLAKHLEGKYGKWVVV